MTGRSGYFAKFAFCIAACRPRLPIPRAYSSVAARIATSFGRAWRFTASTRPRARRVPCGRWWTSRAGSFRCARSTRAKPSVTAQPSPPRGRAASPSWQSVMRTASCARPAPPGANPQPRSSSPGSVAPSPAAYRWTYWPSTPPILPRAPRKGRPFALEPLAGAGRDAPRLASGLAEFDRVTGGGFVRGSVLLLGGDPGIGKSTLLIQVAAALARGGHRAAYISGEEAVAQVRLRAERLGLADAQVELATETSLEDIVATLSEHATPRLVIIDSIPTMWTDQVEAAPRTGDHGRPNAPAVIRVGQ